MKNLLTVVSACIVCSHRDQGTSGGSKQLLLTRTRSAQGNLRKHSGVPLKIEAKALQFMPNIALRGMLGGACSAQALQ